MENEKNLIYSLTFILETQRHRVSITSINFINQPSRALLGGHTQRENLRFPGSFSPSRFSFQPYCPIVSSGCSPRGNSEHPQPGHRALLPVLPTPHPRVFPLLLGGTHQNWLICVPFYGWVIFHCVYVPQLLYPFICQWTSRLLSRSSCCK